MVNEKSLAVLLYLLVFEGDRYDGGRLDKVENLLLFNFRSLEGQAFFHGESANDFGVRVLFADFIV